MRRSARSTKPAGGKSTGDRAPSPSNSELTATYLTPSVSPTPEVPTRHYPTPGNRADGQPKRPMNAFILFSNEKRAELADANPHLSNAAVSVLLGQNWREMSAHEKSGFVAAAKRIKEDFHAQHPDAKTRCVSRKAKRAKLDASRNARSPGSGAASSPPSLHALALAGYRLNHTGAPSFGGAARCDTTSMSARNPSFDRQYSYDDDDDASEEEYSEADADGDDYSAGSPASEAPYGQPTLLEQLCTVAENEHTAAAHMLAALGQ